MTAPLQWYDDDFDDCARCHVAYNIKVCSSNIYIYIVYKVQSWCDDKCTIDADNHKIKVCLCVCIVYAKFRETKPNRKIVELIHI